MNTPDWMRRLGWTLELEDAYDGPAFDLATNEIDPSTHVVVWTLRIQRGDEVVHARWSPAERVLQLEPSPGWSAHLVGRLKRDLIRG